MPPIIAAVMIVRNEARCIVRCLESVRPWVDRLVVVDTGSTDGTPDLARQAGAEVHPSDWPNDFSAARNHSLDLADADWNLVLDADEWVEAGGETLRDFCAGPPRLGRVSISNLFDPPAGTPAGTALPIQRNWATRLLPRGVRYQGRVHEQPIASLPRENMPLILMHDGYLAAQWAGKRNRNRPLLLADLEATPGDPYILYQLGKEAEIQQDHAQASDWYGQALERTDPDANWLHALVVRYLHCLGQAGRVDDAIEIAQGQMERWQESPDFFFVLGNLLLERAKADPGQALDEWLPLAEFFWTRCLEIGERPDLEGSVEGRGSHLARHNLDMLQSQMTLLRNLTGAG